MSLFHPLDGGLLVTAWSQGQRWPDGIAKPLVDGLITTIHTVATKGFGCCSIVLPSICRPRL